MMTVEQMDAVALAAQVSIEAGERDLSAVISAALAVLPWTDRCKAPLTEVHSIVALAFAVSGLGWRLVDDADGVTIIARARIRKQEGSRPR